MSIGALRVAAILAGRQARRHRLRAFAIVATLAVPVAVATAVDVVARSNTLTTAERLDRQLGTAEALVSWFGTGPSVQQAPDPDNGSGPQNPPPTGFIGGQPAPARLPSSLLPAGATVNAEADAYTYFVTGAGGTYAQLRGVDLRAAGAGQAVVLAAGREPTTPGEIDVSPSLARHLHAMVGTTVNVPGDTRALRVVGIAGDRYVHGDDVAFSVISTALELQRVAGYGQTTGISQWYVVSPHPVDWATVLAFNTQGWTVTSRSVILHPPPAAQVPYFRGPPLGGTPVRDSSSTQVGALLGAMVLLEVILLAGPAFAVGARRRSHELAIIAASGGTRRQLVSVVAADGAVLGGVAALGGALLGIAGGAAALAIMRPHVRTVPGAFTLRPWEVVGLASLALVSGLVAALLPALAASKADTAQVLRGRQVPAALSWRPAAAGVAAVAVAGVLGWSNLDPRRGGIVALVGAAALAEVGCALLTPGVLVLAGRTASHLRLWPRLALRDASRNRSAASPAVAAIVAVVAAASAALVYGASLAAHDRATFQPSWRLGDAATYLSAPPGAGVSLNPGGVTVPTATSTQALAAVRAALPGAMVVELRTVGGGPRQGIALAPATPGCPASTVQFFSGGGAGYSISSGLSHGGYASLTCPDPFSGNGPRIAVDDGRGVGAILGGAIGRQAAAALASGRAVVSDPSLLAGGMVTLSLGPGQPSTAHIPAVAVAAPAPGLPLASIVLPPAALPALDLEAGEAAIYVVAAAAQPAAHINAANLALERLGQGGLSVQAPYHDDVSPVLLAVAAGDLLLTLAAAVAATVLVSVDSAEDMRVLAAVGAGPSGRRRLAMSRAGLICGIGAVFGAAAGLIPGFSLVWRLGRGYSNVGVGVLTTGGGVPLGPSYPLHVPWADIGLLVIAAPLLAALTAAAITRTRIEPSRRRAA